MDIGRHFLDNVLLELRKQKRTAERAMAQLPDEEFFVQLDAEANSIALIVKHMAGNMRSRWTDFLTTDGEKADRNRETEFEVGSARTRADVQAWWEDGWRLTLSAIEALEPSDLERTVRIRDESHTVLEAIHRQLTHYAQHVGQIILLAKHARGSEWESLSIPRGQSHLYDVSRSGEPRSI